MATIRLVPSTYYLSNSSYLAVSNADEMYTNVDSTTHGTFTHNRASTNNTYYAYLRGFNFGDVPSNAEVSGFTIKLKASATGHTTSTSTSYQMSLSNGTTQIGSTYASGRLSTSVQTFTFSEGSLTWNTIVGYGSNFSIRIPLRRASSNTADVVSVYGAEIEVTYTIPNPRTVTTTLSGSGTIDPSGTNTYYDGDDFELVIEPTNASDTVTATRNGADITAQLVRHAGGETTEQNVLGEYTLISGGFNSGESWFEGIVGNGYDTDETTTNNYYSSSSSTRAVFQYDVSFSGIPDDATIKSLYMMVNGHAESTSNSNEYMCVQLKSGNTDLSEQLNFKSVGTSNSTQTVTANVIPTVAQLESLVIECELGYYGGAINGATVYLVYEVSGVYYTYSTTISGDMTIAVTIGSMAQDELYIKVNGTAVKAVAVYKRVNGVAVLQGDLTNVFDSGTHYKMS